MIVLLIVVVTLVTVFGLGVLAGEMRADAHWCELWQCREDDWRGRLRRCWPTTVLLHVGVIDEGGEPRPARVDLNAN